MLRRFNDWLLDWKPIHLCWLYRRLGKPIPRYLIGGGGSPPSVTTNAATSIGKLQATLNGNVTSDGGRTITARGFVYSSTDSTPTIGESGVTDTGDLGGTTGTYSNTPTTLTANTLYYYQAYATNDKGTSYGGVQSFTTYNYASTILNTPADTATGQSLTPTLEFTGTDTQSLEVEYNVQVDTVDTFDSQSGSPLIDADSTTDAGFANTVTPADTHPFNSGEKADYDVQAGGVVDSYSESNQEDYWTLWGAGTAGRRAGQSFTGDGTGITTASFYLKKLGSPAGNMVATIYAHTGTFGSTGTPTGSALATSNTISSNSLTTSYALTEFTFSTPFIAVSGTKYFIVLEIDSPGAGTDVYIGIDTASPTHGGNFAWYTVSSTWNAVSGTDACFYVSSPDDTLEENTTYYWRARAKDPAGSNTWGAWSTTRSFTTGVFTYSAGIAVVATTLSVQSVTAAGLILDIASVATITSTLTIQSVTATYQSVVAATVDAVSGLLSVEAVDADGHPQWYFTYEDKVSLPTDNTVLANEMTPAEKRKVDTDDNIYFDTEGSGYIVKNFEVTHDNSTDQITTTWKGKSTLAPTSSTIYLQIYNYNTPAWETLDSDSTTAADTEFTLTGSKTTSLSNYYTTGNKCLARVYQQVV